MLDRSNDGGLVLLVAPAGSGKSVLLSQCTQKTARPTIWLELTEAHNDAVVLTRDLCAAVNTTHPGFDASISESVEVGGARLGDGFLDAFEAGLAQLEEPVELVLDDLHSLTNGDIGADLGTAIRSMGPEARVLLAGRWDPPFRMGRMRLDAETFEIRADELAFDAAEARELLTGLVGRSLDQIDLSTLLERTEGWAAALKLAGLSMRQADDIDLFVKRFDGDDRMVAEYLTEEVLDSLDPPTRQFLFDTAVAPWLDPDLCERLTGRTDALATLEQLNDRGLFVVPVRGHRHRFRYHHLFADLL
ncbi:MAG: AAA family ATPase, partial [Microthrixaceae bacterium]|nr:AAA family ATPase [Microthrixaceae bacterium]